MGCILTYPFIYGSCNQITTPLVYTEDMSVAQQIAHLFGLFQQNDEKYLTQDDFQMFLSWLEAEEEALIATLQQYTDSTADELRDLIEKLTGGMLQFDPQTGDYEDTKTAAYDMFNDLAVHALTSKALAESEYTVATLAESGMSVRGLAVYSGTFNDVAYIDPGVTV